MRRLLLILIGWLTLCLSAQAQSVYKMQYWFDGQYSARVTDSNATGQWQTQLDVSHLSEGLHSVYFHFCDTSGRWSSPRMYNFHKADSEHLTYICWFNEDYSHHQKGSVGTGVLQLNVDSLADGTHVLNILLGEGGNTLLKSQLFVKVPISEQLEDSTYLRFFYMVDGHDWPAVPVDANTGLAHLDIDVGMLSTGIHTLDYFILSSDGRMSTPTRAFFYSGNNGIHKYEWWLNEGDTAKHVVEMMPQNPFQLVTMLMVDTLPIRPSCLHFVPMENTPLIYAKNDAHFRFWDNRGDFVQIDKQYVDYNVVDTVYADTLERNTCRTIVTPTGGEIHWFKLGVSVGDSMAFMTNRACGLQLYSPSGEEVFSASGVRTISFGGCHAFQEGVYYLAVHSANTGGDSLIVHYQHIEKYALLAFSPTEFGNWIGSRFNIEMLGNGFNLLDSVLLIYGSDTLKSDTLFDRGRTTVTASFTIDGTYSNGIYDLVLHFSDTLGPHTIVSPRAITLAQPNFGEIRISISGPSGEMHPMPIVITVENTGNMDYSYVPFNIAITHPDVVKKMTLKNYLVDCGNAYEPDSNGVIIWVDSLFGNKLQAAVFPTYIPHLGSKTKQTYELELDVYSFPVFDVYAWSGNPFEYYLSRIDLQDSVEYSSAEGLHAFNSKASNDQQNSGQLEENRIHYPSLIECDTNLLRNCLQDIVIDRIGDVISNLSARLIENGYVVGLARTLSSSFLCSAEIYGTALNAEYLFRNEKALKGNRTPDTEFATNIVADRARKVVWSPWRFCGCLGHIAKAYARRASGNCMSTEKGGYHANFMRRPYDPNDITGYIAESGSKHIRKDIETVSYDIEFENDTVRATAPAHTVVVRDTLDANQFDFSSFEWNSIHVGEHAELLNGGKKVYTTIDLRPAINVLAEAVLEFDTLTGVATCTISSLEPMTLEPVIDYSRGILPINYFGQGEGSVSYTINLVSNLADGTLINNRASIVFDNEDAILTPIWTNTIDYVAPVSHISHADTIGDSITLYFQSTDDGSGIWRYNLYNRQDTADGWTIVANNIEDTLYRVALDENMIYYKVIAIDSAGNEEKLDALPIVTSFYDTVYATSCDYYIWYGNEYHASGEYVRTVPSDEGNDSIITLFLTIGHKQHSYTEVTACNSYEWNDTVYAESGVYSYNTSNAVGCDSAATLNLTINVSTSSTTDFTACDSYEWNDSIYTESGVYTFETENAAGCDSIATLNLTVNNSTTSTTDVTACNSYEWNGTVYTESGAYTYTTENAAGCDSTATLNLTINVSTTITTDIAACNSYEWNGTVYTESGAYTYTAENAAGCDSTATLNLTINVSTTSTTEATACNSYEWNGVVYTESDTLRYTTTDINGCDSTTVVALTIGQKQHSYTEVTYCGPYTWSLTGQTYNKSGLKFHKGTTPEGCPIRDTLELTIIDRYHSYTEVENCGPYTWDKTGQTYNKSGLKFYKGTADDGCPIRDTLKLTVTDRIHSYTEVTSCGPYTWQLTGQTYNKSGMKFYKGTMPNGCLIRDTLVLTVTDRIHSYTEVISCGPYTWQLTGQTYNKSGLKFYKGTMPNGCLIRDTLKLTVTDRIHSYTEVTNCGPYTWDVTGQTYNKSGLKFNKGVTSDGCLIRDTLKLTVVDRWSSHDTVVSCDGPYTWDKTGQTYKKTGMKFFKGTANDGCPIRDTLYVIISQKEHSYTEETSYGPYYWDKTGKTYNKSGLKFYKGTNEYGCSIRDTLNLTVLPASAAPESYEYQIVENEEGTEFPNPILNSQFSTLNTIKVFPNPTTGVVYLARGTGSAPEGILNSKIEVLDLVGRRVALFENTNTLDLSGLVNGTYTLRVTMPDGVTLRKVVKK